MSFGTIFLPPEERLQSNQYEVYLKIVEAGIREKIQPPDPKKNKLVQELGRLYNTGTDSLEVAKHLASRTENKDEIEPKNISPEKKYTLEERYAPKKKYELSKRTVHPMTLSKLIQDGNKIEGGKYHVESLLDPYESYFQGKPSESIYNLNTPKMWPKEATYPNTSRTAAFPFDSSVATLSDTHTFGKSKLSQSIHRTIHQNGTKKPTFPLITASPCSKSSVMKEWKSKSSSVQHQHFESQSDVTDINNDIISMNSISIQNDQRSSQHSSTTTFVPHKYLIDDDDDEVVSRFTSSPTNIDALIPTTSITTTNTTNTNNMNSLNSYSGHLGSTYSTLQQTLIECGKVRKMEDLHTTRHNQQMLEAVEHHKDGLSKHIDWLQRPQVIQEDKRQQFSKFTTVSSPKSGANRTTNQHISSDKSIATTTTKRSTRTMQSKATSAYDKLESLPIYSFSNTLNPFRLQSNQPASLSTDSHGEQQTKSAANKSGNNIRYARSKPKKIRNLDPLEYPDELFVKTLTSFNACLLPDHMTSLHVVPSKKEVADALFQLTRKQILCYSARVIEIGTLIRSMKDIRLTTPGLQCIYILHDLLITAAAYSMNPYILSRRQIYDVIKEMLPWMASDAISRLLVAFDNTNTGYIRFIRISCTLLACFEPSMINLAGALDRNPLKWKKYTKHETYNSGKKVKKKKNKPQFNFDTISTIDASLTSIDEAEEQATKNYQDGNEFEPAINSPTNNKSVITNNTGMNSTIKSSPTTINNNTKHGEKGKKNNDNNQYRMNILINSKEAELNYGKDCKSKWKQFKQSHLIVTTEDEKVLKRRQIYHEEFLVHQDELAAKESENKSTSKDNKSSTTSSTTNGEVQDERLSEQELRLYRGELLVIRILHSLYCQCKGHVSETNMGNEDQENQARMELTDLLELFTCCSNSTEDEKSIAKLLHPVMKRLFIVSTSSNEIDPDQIQGQKLSIHDENTIQVMMKHTALRSLYNSSSATKAMRITANELIDALLIHPALLREFIRQVKVFRGHAHPYIHNTGEVTADDAISHFNSSQHTN